MQLVNASELEFTSDDNENWAAFLRSKTGQRLIPKLAEAAPRLLAKGDTNEILIANGALLGFQTAVQALLDLTHVPEPPPAVFDPYPPLPPEH